ncbi:hypothetical protein HGRIS_004840 [Hohenbuehelia grisea]|uniref:Uncharacterized protein n=1 Tax=Hohenbuehelia grisea TaxID=104357 RepID=A0ABR3JES7_9AGAR
MQGSLGLDLERNIVLPSKNVLIPIDAFVCANALKMNTMSRSAAGLLSRIRLVATRLRSARTPISTSIQEGPMFDAYWTPAAPCVLCSLATLRSQIHGTGGHAQDEYNALLGPRL